MANGLPDPNQAFGLDPTEVGGENPPQSKKKTGRLVLILLVVLTAGGGTWFLLSRPSHSTSAAQPGSTNNAPAAIAPKPVVDNNPLAGMLLPITKSPLAFLTNDPR